MVMTVVTVEAVATLHPHNLVVVVVVLEFIFQQIKLIWLY
jgi:hypothetical protein